MKLRVFISGVRGEGVEDVVKCVWSWWHRTMQLTNNGDYKHKLKLQVIFEYGSMCSSVFRVNRMR